MTAKTTSQAEIERRCVRYPDLVPCREAFIDRRIPGCEGNENFTVIGPGVAEAADNHVHIRIPHGFNIGGARQAPGAINSQHSHETPEVFVVHFGEFRFHFGPDRQDGSIVLRAGDTISVPIRVFRGFENVGNKPGYLFAVLAEDDPGRVTWAPSVLKAAKGTGLVLLEDGRLVDTEAKGKLPPDSPVMQPLTETELGTFDRLQAADAEGSIARNNALVPDTNSPLSGTGIEECPVIGTISTEEGVRAGPISDCPGFHLRRVRMAPGSSIASHSRQEIEVLFVHRGNLLITWPDGSLELSQGDHLTLPVGLPRYWDCQGGETAEIVVIRGGSQPASPVWN